MSIRLKSLYCFLFSFTVYVTLYIGQGQGKQDSILTPATDFLFILSRVQQIGCFKRPFVTDQVW